MSRRNPSAFPRDAADPARRRLLKAGLGAAAATVGVPALGGCDGQAPPRPGDPVWRNWSGGQSARPKAWHNPADEQALRQSLRATKGSVRVTGAGHSFSPLCNTDDTLFSLDAISGIVDHDSRSKQATVYGGTRLRDLGEPLWGMGQALINQGDVDVQALAGACATSTHGTGRALGSFSSMVRGVRLVTVDGEMIDADAESNAEVWQAARCSLGALGIVSRIRLQNRAPYNLHEREFLLPLREVLDSLDERLARHRHFEFWAFFHGDPAIVKTLDETDAPPTPTSDLQLPVSHALDISAFLAHRVPASDALLQKALLALHSETDRVGPSWRIFPSERESRFNEMEYEVPLARGPECLTEIIETVRASGLRTLFPMEYRVVAADDCWLSPFYQRDSAAISVHAHHSVDYRPLFALVEPIFWKYAGRPHWGKLHSLTAEALSEHYPRWPDFQRVRRQLDPNGRLLNAHLMAVFDGQRS